MSHHFTKCSCSCLFVLQNCTLAVADCCCNVAMKINVCLRIGATIKSWGFLFRDWRSLAASNAVNIRSQIYYATLHYNLCFFLSALVSFLIKLPHMLSSSTLHLWICFPYLQFLELPCLNICACKQLFVYIPEFD